MRGITALGGRGLRFVVLSLFSIAFIYVFCNGLEKAAPYALDVSKTGFYPTQNVDAQALEELVSPEVTTLGDEDHPASAKWNYEAMSKIKHKLGTWLPMDRVYGAMHHSTWMDHTKSTNTPNYNHAPSSSKGGQNTIVGKVSVLNDPKDEYVDRAIKTHNAHDKRHGYQHHIRREQSSTSTANDHFAAQMLSVLQAELSKPQAERLEWFYYLPATSIILNPSVPLELFLPPTKTTTFNETHLLYSAPVDTSSSISPDLFSTAFAARVHPWSVDLFTTLVARTQAASKKASSSSSHSNAIITIHSLLSLASPLSPHQHALALPPHWLNAWPSPNEKEFSDEDDYDYDDSDEDARILHRVHRVRPGSFVLTLPSPEKSTSSSSHDPDTTTTPSQRRFEHWLARAESRTPRWEVPLQETSYADETRAFWEGASSPSSSSSSFSLFSSPAAASAWGLASSSSGVLPTSSSHSYKPGVKQSDGVSAGAVAGGAEREKGGAAAVSSSSTSSSSSLKTNSELKEEALTLVREMEASVHNWRQEVSDEVRRATESRCGRAREALAEVELDYGIDDGNEGASSANDQVAREKLQAVIAGLKVGS